MISARTMPAAGLLAAGMLAGASPAMAAAAPTALDASQYTLTADYHQFDTLNSALVNILGTSAVHTVMANANHDRQPLPSSFSVAGLSGGFRFDEHWTLLATWEHISNAGTCSRNVGLNNYGLKLGYRF